MAAWPSTLPSPTTSDYALQEQSALGRSDMEAGPARTRRRFTRVPRQVPAAWILTLDELATFEAWFHDVIADGADWFDCTLLNGRGMNPVRCRFLIKENDKAWEVKPQGNGQVWKLMATLEVDSMPRLASLDGRL